MTYVTEDPIWCSWCQEGHAATSYCSGLVAARLRALLVCRQRGVYRPSHLAAFLELADIEHALRAAVAAGFINELEVSILILRLVQGLDRKATAARLRRPNGRPISLGHVSRITKLAVKKLADWLNATMKADYPSINPSDGLPKCDGTS